MTNRINKAGRVLALLALVLCCSLQASAQCTSGSISGGSGFYNLLVTPSGNVFLISDHGQAGSLSGTLNLSFVGTGCSWSVSTGVSWLTASPSSGTSSTSTQAVTLTAAPNTGSTVLQTAINLTVNSIASGAYYADQNTSLCAIPSLTPSSKASPFTAAGGSDSFTVNTNISGCWFGQATYPSWVTPGTPAGHTINYTTSANTGAARNGSVSFAYPTSIAYTFSEDSVAPSVTSSSPSSIPQGTARTVTFTGSNFFTGDTASVSTTGVTIGALSIISSTQASALVTIASNTALGSFQVQFTSPLATATSNTSLTVVAPLVITAPTSLSTGTAQISYGPVNFTATGGSGGYSWSATGLPSGLSINAAGSLSGTPTASGSFNPMFTVTDSQHNTTSVSLGLTINAAAQTAITIQTSPTGLLFSVDGGVAQTAPQTVNLSQGSHTIAVTTTQAGGAGTQNVFTSWSDGGAASHSINVGSSAATYTATFKTQYQLTTSASPTAGGTITPVSGGYHDSGSVVQITASPNNGFTFSGWSGNVANAAAASTTVTMSAPETVTANFASSTGETIQTNPPGLLFSVDGGAAQAAPQTLSLSQGQHTIAVATTQAGTAGTQYVFASWSDGGAASHTITVGSSAATYTATFTTQYQLTISASPSAGGTVTPASGSYYDSGSAVPITATASSGYTFTSWTGSVANASSASTTVTMSAPEAVTATFSVGGPTGPTITMVQNNYSYILPNAPNYGIAPGALLIVVGTGMATPGSQAVLEDPSKGLPLTLNGASVSVTVNGTTVQPAFYYAIPTQLGIVLPSNTPLGTGQITVSFGNQTSAPSPIQVVAHAFGFDYYGGALAGITDNIQDSPRPGHLITTSHAAALGETVTFWGAGDGADVKNDDVNKPTSFDNLNGITAFYLGGVQVPAGNILYQGRSAYQGVDQINVTIPTNAPTGCAVSAYAVSGSGSDAIVSNFVAVPIAATDGQCADPLSYLDPATASTLSGQATVKFGSLSMLHDVAGSTTTDAAAATFYSIPGYQLGGYQGSTQPSLGSCFVTQTDTNNKVSPFTITGLDAGSISVAGPNGTQSVPALPGLTGSYFAQLPSGFIPPAGGAFTFTGTGGKDVGAVNAAVDSPGALVWTNSSADATIARTQGVTITWTGGAAGTYAQITGNAVSSSTHFSGSFVCDVPVTAGTFTVPAPVLGGLPAGPGALGISNITLPQTFTATGLDFGFELGAFANSINVTYN